MLAVSMAGFQVSIGALNDLRDRDADALAQPWKPIPSGRVTPRVAGLVVGLGAGVGIAGSLVLGPGTLLVGLVGYGLGVAYDLGLKRTAWGWLCLALALPLVPVYAWLGVGSGPPSAVWALVLIGGLAGTQLAVANGLVDAPADGRAGGRGIAVRLGPRRARLAMAAAAVGVISLAWLSLVASGAMVGWSPAGSAATGLLLLGSVILCAGVVMSLRGDPAWSWRGWQTQAIGVAIVAMAWLASVT